jgi:small subunit ribosomal protein S16
MVVIRCSPAGRKHSPVYKLFVAHKDDRLTGRFLEKLGTIDPAKKDAQILEFKQDRYEHWLKQGAIPSTRVKHIVKKHQQVQS